MTCSFCSFDFSVALNSHFFVGMTSGEESLDISIEEDEDEDSETFHLFTTLFASGFSHFSIWVVYFGFETIGVFGFSFDFLIEEELQTLSSDVFHFAH